MGSSTDKNYKHLALRFLWSMKAMSGVPEPRRHNKKLVTKMAARSKDLTDILSRRA